MLRRFSSILMLLSVAACGTGTTSPAPDPDPAPEPIAFDTFAGGQSIASGIEAANTDLGLTNPADLLVNGSATYQGTAEISSTAGLNAIGVMNMSVVFETGNETVGGSATDFVDQDDNPVSGALGIVSGSFDRNGGAGANLTVGVTGNFEGTTHVLQAQSPISGDFYGNAEGMILQGDVQGFVNEAPTTYNIRIVTELAD
ncbi:hypothetical protein JQU17_06760 [Ponticoccus sp. SC2-23]|uniref:hypothetical protein n=1 Tax=Alexandriicola marinus TaxID=2081710 RepID=UPI000FD99CD9|nr:hypothetical protein [Alexandriicola marinus]MBM1220613.1 hypothetical protein [Ponticoccus sp. SC6-9]MBM1225299.1 hypothetical protein [Ponticoccus sp. SC6-15]MBM1228813.1 hypothetical protein [Ponticoccus sp. SC6-38]MBM1233550.1 hypothetical protein [Ponticoccus sp. SC6-45]MBM1239314.1 hypothetical protein [Ponticoccus sp. SC6-49]MBM1243096.1 hypothetical protein [Ponticoccus sp. SC2-64]MBM1247074.1 hypothetical protein [Ponticoccus sp. SC6-42]MBM1252267.1 hypothetical protein [Pontico